MSAASAALRLGIAHPIVQGPFGGGLSSARLAATVSNAGGLGSFGAHHLPPQAILDTAREIRALTSQPFALNLWISNFDAGGEVLDQALFERGWRVFEPFFRELGLPQPQRPAQHLQRYDDQVAALLEAAPAVFSFVFGVPSPAVLQACRQRDIATVGAATTIAEAQALENAGVDLIVATGFEAGGHRPSFLAPAEDVLTGTFSLVQLIAPRVGVPVIAAGGIVDARGIRAAQALGASAAQIGTAFLACEESAAAPAHRALLFDPSQRTALTRAFSGRLARGLANRWTDAFRDRHGEILPYPVQGWFAAQMRQAALAANRTDLIALWSGQSAPNLKHHDAGSLMRDLVQSLASP